MYGPASTLSPYPPAIKSPRRRSFLLFHPLFPNAEVSRRYLLATSSTIHCLIPHAYLTPTDRWLAPASPLLRAGKGSNWVPNVSLLPLQLKYPASDRTPLFFLDAVGVSSPRPPCQWGLSSQLSWVVLVWWCDGRVPWSISPPSVPCLRRWWAKERRAVSCALTAPCWHGLTKGLDRGLAKLGQAYPGSCGRGLLWSPVHSPTFQFLLEFHFKFNLGLNHFKFCSNIVFQWDCFQTLNANRKSELRL
jgi:hypothetical protein